VVPHIEPEVGYDILNDFVAISTVMTVPIVLVVRPELPVRTVAEFVAYMRANPGRVSFGSSGPGQSPHMASELLLKLTGIEAVISPYRGAPPAVNDLLAGSIQAMFDTTTSRPSIEAGRLRALAIGSQRRSTLMPDVPTMDESGFPGFEISSWYVLFAPTGTPVEIVRQLNGVITRSLADPTVRARLAAVNAEAIPSTPEEATAFVRWQLDNWGGIVRRIRGPQANQGG
jgi:tripartite-type tricarboxylate transporter receptor subunit TctC